VVLDALAGHFLRAFGRKQPAWSWF